MKFQIVKGKSTSQPFFFRIVAANGQTLAVSENYTAPRTTSRSESPTTSTRVTTTTSTESGPRVSDDLSC